MEARAKYLSYFWNVEEQKRESASSIFKRKMNEDTSSGLFLNILFSFLVIVSFASGLRYIEENLLPNASAHEPEKRFFMPALAAEASSAAQISNPAGLNVYLKPNSDYTFTLKIKNTGSSTWTQEKVFLKTGTSAFKFKSKTWTDLYVPARLEEKSVLPGEIGTFKLAVTAPKTNNSYSGEFLLVEDNLLIPGGEITININVTDNPREFLKPVVTTPIAPTSTSISTLPSIQPQICTLKLKLKISNNIEGIDNATCAVLFGFPSTGPNIRVGLFNTDKVISIRNDATWQILDADNNLLATVEANEIINFYFNKTKKEYSFDFGNKTIRTKSYLKLQNADNNVFEITSLQDLAPWNKKINYNKFNGSLEIRHNTYKDRVWLIETLPLEEYVKGIKETSNPDPIEYLKTMAVAARTYALYHVNSGTKHAKEFYDVDSYYDQVYKGYVVRETMPRVEEAASATSGMVATYDNQLIVAAYFARGDGKTRSYKEVWKKDIPYLVSVETNYTAGKELWGHGVGIDATDALNKAKKDNWTFDQLVKYYYTGVGLEKIY